MENLDGKRFGRLIVLKYVGRSKSDKPMWLCKCDCGNEKVVLAGSLKSGETKSCGCLHRDLLRASSKDIVGKSFGILRIEEVFYQGGIKYCRCKCGCGKEVVRKRSGIRSTTNSCGCLRSSHVSSSKIRHGSCGESLYNVWRAMRQRCNNPKQKDYKYYGAQGVKVCSEWDDYSAFKSWSLSHGYESGLTIDRVNPFGNYEPHNCRFITIQEQQRNRRLHYLERTEKNGA